MPTVLTSCNNLAPELEEVQQKKDRSLKGSDVDWVERESSCAPLRNRAKWLIKSEYFEHATSLVILGNTVTSKHPINLCR